VPTDLVGQRLDGAESELDGNGITYTPIGGGAFGTIVKSNREVCQTRPGAGQPMPSTERRSHRLPLHLRRRLIPSHN
jgi:hypothetical protein